VLPLLPLLLDLWEHLEQFTYASFLLCLLFVLLSQPHFGISVRVKPTLPKVGSWSLPGLLKIQSSSSGVKSPLIRVFFMSLERS
jgi:hypothetical protein